jgi:hypothetical protein
MVILALRFVILKIKDELHHLIDTIDDEQLLKSYYQLIQSININSGGKLWSALNELEKQEFETAVQATALTP